MTRIYYNDLFIDDEKKVIEIYEGCEFVECKPDEVDDLIEEMFDWGEWNCFVIPAEVTDYKVILN